MGKKLAIKGHSTRGKEVIELLEMLGGKNIHNLYGNNSFEYYVSGHAILNDRLSIIEDDDFVIFTLQDFLDKFPYKVGDKVHIYVQNDDIDGRYDIEATEITSMRWNPARCKIAYKMKDINREFYKEEIKCKVDDSTKSIDNPINSSQLYELGMENTKKEIVTRMDVEDASFILNYMILPNKMDDKLEYDIVDGYEFDKVENGKIILKPIKPKYPTTYVECKEMLDENVYCGFSALMTLRNLIICRNAYWKIAGEQMGLGKPWEPDWNNISDKYTIYPVSGEIRLDKGQTINTVLAFPTVEMRDAFYENFKNLIEECKELL